MRSTVELARRRAGYALDCTLQAIPYGSEGGALSNVFDGRIGASAGGVRPRLHTTERMLENARKVLRMSRELVSNATGELAPQLVWKLPDRSVLKSFFEGQDHVRQVNACRTPNCCDVHYLFCSVSIEGRFAMSEEIPEEPKSKLAYWIAQGKSIAVWARQNGVHRGTAYRWAKQAEVREIVNWWRRQSMDRALGRMARRSSRAADGILRWAEELSQSRSGCAWRAILNDQMQVAQFADLEYRMTELEQEIKAEKQAQAQ